MIASIPTRQIRAVYDSKTIRVYQAYSDVIADSALKHQTFVAPPFKMDRMTWIKPSFLWMMYRACWGYKDEDQKRILAIDITREGFEWALAHSCPSHPDPGMSHHEWEQLKSRSPVRIQWDPERDLLLQPLEHRAIQIGLSKEAVQRYTGSGFNGLPTPRRWRMRFTHWWQKAASTKRNLPSQKRWHTRLLDGPPRHCGFQSNLRVVNPAIACWLQL